VLIESFEDLQPLAVAKLLKALVDKEQPSLILLGKQAIDDDSNQTGQMLAALANLPQATFASKVVVADGKATVSREVDGGAETLSLTLPAVITTDLRLSDAARNRHDLAHHAGFLQPHRFLDRDFIERIHRHLRVRNVDTRAIRLDPHLHVVVDHSLYPYQHFHTVSFE
jgi:hypothetical protein